MRATIQHIWRDRLLKSILVLFTVLLVAALAVIGMSACASGQVVQGSDAQLMLSVARLEEQVKSLQTTTSELRETVTKLSDCVTTSREAIAGLNVKAGVWGLLGGLIPAFGALVLWAMNRVRSGNGKEKAKA